MELDLEYRYVKMCRKRNKTFVEYRDKFGKSIKTSSDRNSQLKALLEKNK
jgi:hypothetical protein